VRKKRQSGFTLVEILVVIAIIALIIGLVTPTLFQGQERAHVVACQNNLKEIGTTILLYKGSHENRFPSASGIRFFLEPWRTHEIEHTEKNAKIYVCPGDTQGTFVVDPETGEFLLEDLEAVDSRVTSYAGRNTRDYPLRKVKLGDQAIVSDDWENGPNHRNVINVLFADLSFQSMNVREDLDSDPNELVVGEESQVEILRVLSID
jgi:prepilin-type N-terminal cleavage/methylation domain-containing protein